MGDTATGNTDDMSVTTEPSIVNELVECEGCIMGVKMSDTYVLYHDWRTLDSRC